MADLTLSFNWPQTWARAALRPGTTVTLPWGRGVGKSWFLRTVWLLRVAEWEHRQREGYPDLRGIRVVVLGPTRKQMVDVHGAHLQGALVGPWGFLRGDLNRTTWRVEFPGGSWIQFFGAENADNARGVRCDVVCVDECDDVDPSTYDSIVTPWLSEPWSLKERLLAGTPRRGRFGLLYRQHRFALEQRAKFASLQATYRDAPEQVDGAFVEEVRETTPPEVFAREWECNFDSGEGLVYPMFDEAFHVRRPRPGIAWNEILIGADHGFEDPGVLLVLGVQGAGRDAVVHVLGEIYERRKDPTWWLERVVALARRYPNARWFADPSRPDLIASWRNVGAKMLDTDNAIAPGVEAVADRLCVRQRVVDTGTPKERALPYARLFIAPECANTIREMSIYRRRRDPKSREQFLDDIEDRNNHAMDALRYAVFGRFGRPLLGGGLPQNLVAA